MSKFSGVLQITDLDDFITPSQVCKTQQDSKIYYIQGSEELANLLIRNA